MADKSQDSSYQAGVAMGQAEIKKAELADKASDAIISAKESCQEAGQQVKAMARGAADSVKDATRIHKNR